MNTVVQLRTSNLDLRLAQEDRLEDAGRLAPDDRMTCHVHGRWIHQCASSAAHVNQVTRHRWCRECRTALTVAVDELTLTVHMSCPACGDGRSAATRRLEAACEASLSYTKGRPAALAS
ncbi:hypothetical protein DMH04_42390 [Kibdelosporangium aridum]|uniref:Uncharacterized protein n=1 Tax=Kibdelosporangium aridum TaxID=2030 RepID=A0A428YT13_KIBAR|nr:hypothetical protein [Kibdelosporangium aridum]RSM72628.1 hypothetical protein DMH04_42390 [Kibdelosporangium aridum]